MASLVISPESPLSADSRRLIDGSEAALHAVYPPEECFSFSPEELANDATTFFVARLDGRAVGCIALVNMGDYGEVKRMYVAPAAQGNGIGKALLARLEDTAAAAGLRVVKLETGYELAAAVAIYERSGFRPCDPFGGYPDIPSNVFMEKRLVR